MAFKRNPLSSKPGRAPERIEPLIVRIQNQRVVLDADLAQIYGVTTTAFNQAFKRNSGRFPKDFAFQLTQVEFANLMSQNVISSLHATDSNGKTKDRSQSVIGSHGGRRKLPWVFTEHGALMAATFQARDLYFHRGYGNNQL